MDLRADNTRRLTLARSLTHATLLGACDFHMHSTASDGSETPERIAELLCEARLNAAALTDHDTVAGLPSLLKALSDLEPIYGQIPYIFPGAELSLDFDGTEVHVLAYFADLPTALQLHAYCLLQQSSRKARNKALIKSLREHGFNVSMNDIKRYAEDGSEISRLHVALWLRDQGHVQDLAEAFDRWLKPGCPCYVSRKQTRVKDGIDVIHSCGGVAFLAHPQQYHWIAEGELETPSLDAHSAALLFSKIQELQAYGLDGLEVWHGAASPKEQYVFKCIADELGLERSAGSDWHGTNKENAPMYTRSMRFS